MNTLYVRLPPRIAAESASHWKNLVCAFAQSSRENGVDHQGTAPLSELSGRMVHAGKVVLILPAVDVTLLNLPVPPLSPSRLKAALPNLVEEYLLDDPLQCVIVAGDAADGKRSVAIVARDWIGKLAAMLEEYGIRNAVILPAQTCLPWQPGGTVAAISGNGAACNLTVRLSEQEGYGLSVSTGQTAPRDTLEILRAVIPQAHISLYVPGDSVAAYHNVIDSGGFDGIEIMADHWPFWMTGAADSKLDLLADMRRKNLAALDWHAWRWPLRLAAMVLIINLAALNYDWWQMRREAGALRTAMFQTYQATFPDEKVIIDPLAQLQQKIAVVRHHSGQPAPDDLTAMLAALGEAWPGDTDAASNIAGFDYHDRTLLVRFKSGKAVSDRQVRPALSRRNLTLDTSPGQPDSWEIRMAK